MVIAAPLLVGLGILLAAMLLMAMHQASSGWLRPVFRALFAPIVAFIPGAGFIGSLLDRALARLVAETEAVISRGAGAALGALGGFFNGLTHVIDGYTNRVESFAESVTTTLEYWALHGIPNAVGGAIVAPRHLAEQAIRRANEAWQVARRAERATARAVGAAAAIPQLRRRIGTLGRTLDALRTLARGIDRRARSLARRLTRVEKLTAAAAFTALIVRVLARKLPWLFCRRVDRVARTVCGVDADLLTSLLSTALVVASVVELRAMARALEEPTRLTMDGVSKFIRELD